eukprot:scaffold15.g4312.t1
MREMRVKEVAEQLEDEEYIWVDPDNPTPRPEMAPLERTVSLPYEEALFTDAVDPEAMQYWFTEPPGGWQTEPRKLRKAHAEQPEGFDDFAHPGEGRTALAALREGQMLQGRVVAHLLYHGMQIDIGAEYDGLLPLGEEHWEGLMREAPLFRFPIQLDAVDPALAERLPPSEEHIAPMDLRVMPMSVEELVETEGEVHAANGAHWHWEEVPQAVPPSLEQIHLAATGNPTEMRVSWTTRGEGCPTRVAYAPGDAVEGTAGLVTADSGQVDTYSHADMCASPARDFSYQPLYLHSVVMTGLAPGQAYVYKIPHGRALAFRAPPKLGPRHAFTFLVYGDMGESEHREAKSPGAAATARRVAREVEAGAGLVLHVGDLSYANGAPHIWDTFMEAIEPFAAHVPYMVAVGNHEYDYKQGSRKDPDISGEDRPYSPDWGNYGNDSGGECGVAAAKRFPMPDAPDLGYWPGATSARSLSGNPTLVRKGGAGGPPGRAVDVAARRVALELPSPGQSAAAVLALAAGERADAGGAGGGAAGNSRRSKPNPPFWYAFSHGPVHFVVLSTEHDLKPGSDQHAWVKRDLQRVDRCRTPWVVVAMHRPQYVVYPHKSNRVVGEHLRQHVEHLFDKYEVDLVLSGHMHSYSRACNVLGGRCVLPADGGMTHVTVGTGGKKLSQVERDQEEWLEYAQDSDFGYGRVTVDGRFSLRFEFVTSEGGEVLDSTTIRNIRADLRACNYDAFD